MAFNLTGVVRVQMITELFIPNVRYSMVSDKFVTTKSDVDAESIKIWGVGTVTVGDYTGGVIAGNFHVDTSVLLTLNQSKYFSENVENIDSKQSAIDILPPIIEQGSYGIGQEIDQSVFVELATTTEVVADPVLDSTNVAKWIGDIGVKMTNNGAPRSGRALALSPEQMQVVSEANLTLNTSTAEEAAKEGYIGRFGGFTLYESVNTGTSGTAIASVPSAGALGLGYNTLKAEEIPGQVFTTALGVVNFGVKIVKGSFVVKSVVTFG